MGVLQKIAMGFLDGWNNADRGKQKYKPYKPSEIDLRRYDRDFEFRLMRARTEPMEILEYSNEAHTAAKIKSCTSGKTYNVTERQCECEDYQKNHKPCKHIIFLLLKNGHYKNREVGPPREPHKGTNSDGRFVPLYWKYYSGSPNGLGYTNLLTYRVVGREYGVSKKTGKQTNRKKEVYVNASNEDDAEKAAAEVGAMPPYADIETVDICPTYRQYQYLHGAEIPIPYFINTSDVSALLTRFEDEDDDVCPNFLIDLATKCRVKVSRFQSPSSVKSCIWAALPKEKRAAAFCYAVYCKEKNCEFGNTPIKFGGTAFSDFQPTEKELSYILDIQEFGWKPLHRNAAAYKSAVAYLESKNLI